MKRRAKIGGQVGANGELYKGGQFIAQTEKPKAQSRRPGTRRSLIWPGQWAVTPEGKIAIFSAIREFVYLAEVNWLKIKPNMTDSILEAFGESRESLQAKIDRLHSGEAWEDKP